MKFSPKTSRYVSVCLCLLFSYALLISNIGPIAHRSAVAASVERTLEGPVKNSLHTGSTGPEKQANSPAPATFSQSSNQAQSRDGEVLVKFRASASEQDKNVVALTHGVQRKKLRGESGVEILRTQAGQSSESLAVALLQQPAVEFAEPNFLIKPDQTSSGNGPTPNDSQFAEQWALKNTGQNGGQYGSDIGTAAAWQVTTGSQSTVIAVIDSGIDFTHADLIDNQWVNLEPSIDGDLHGWDYVTANGTIKDEQGHGTAIAGIIAASGNNATGISGVMWKASLMSLRVLDNTGTGDIGDAVEAIDYAVAHGAQVINISWGTNGESLVLKDAIERAIRSGVVVVCSAGNGSQDVDALPYYPASFGLRDLITVASTDNFDQLATWSNWGTKNVTVAAPGIAVRTTKMGGGYWSVTGTSASAPLVAGVAGLIRSAHPSLNTHKVVEAITDEARKVASLFGKVSSGGVVNASSSLASVRATSNQPPSTPRPGYGSGGTGPGGTFSTTPPPQRTDANGSNLANIDQARNGRSEPTSARAPIESNLPCLDCEPAGGGGGGNYPAGDPDFSGPRSRPANETGAPGVDLGSRNFNWSLPLVSLAGRAGMDLGLTLFYNSLVWTKEGSNIKYNADRGAPGPGFRLGLPTMQQRFLNSQTGVYAYMMVMPSGGRVEMRQVGSSNIYESQDRSYTQLDMNNPSAPVVRTTDGTQLTFTGVTINSEYRCTQIKDRNGNFISATYDSVNGHMLSVTDTLGRVITFVYDGSSNLQSIRQTWDGATHDWATFNYESVYVAPNFGGGLAVNGPNNAYVTVLNRVNLHDGSYFTFNYNAAFGQVNQINRYAADAQLLSYTAYTLNTSAGQTDCPRFTERRDWAENWNNGAPAVTTYSVAGDSSWIQQTAPDGSIYKEFFATTGWQTGLSTRTENWSAGVLKKWTTVSWTQDETGLAYQKNPRVTETNISDAEGNLKRTTISYGPYASYSLPYEVIEYASDGVTMLRRTYTDYNLSGAYIDRRLIGLVSAVYVVDHASSSYVSKMSFGYDYGGEYMTSQTAIQHDDSSYGSGMVTRGNRTVEWRWDVNDINNSTKALPQRTGYNSTGSVVFRRDALGHQTTVGYTDSFSDGNNSRNTNAYPTTVTDPDNYSSTSEYKYDFGAVTRTQDPKGAVKAMLYDSAARIDRVTNQFNGSYRRWVYDSHGNVSTFETIQEGAGEAYVLQVFDGAGRIYQSAVATPLTVGGYTAQLFRYDSMGQLTSRSNPTEVNGAWNASGDDAAGPSWTNQTYDWKGRPLITTNPDGSTLENTYGGCGCAGGEATTMRDERGRRRKLKMDVVGRLNQVDELNWDQSVYATTTYAYNSRNQITSSNQSGQSRTFNYDGYGRLTSKTTPEQGTMNYSYYADDGVQTISDARGAVTTFSYNNRHLVNAITHSAGAWATTPGVSFGYDTAGNRTSMTDGLGSVAYNYNTISRLTSETRTLTSVGAFTLSYAYNLSGELISVTNPWGAQVGYNYDTVGRATAVSGSGYASLTTYVSNITYRAFGMKGMSYSNGKTLSIQYDNRMRATQWSVPGVMRWDYSYTNFGENTGRVTSAKNLDDGTLDRSYDYDQVGRMWASHSGREARWHLGQEAYSGADGPYAYNNSYDQWGNITSRNGWGVVNASYTASYANNRRVGFGYDASGNLTSDGSQAYTYDATGQQATASGASLSQSYDGDTLRAKKVENGTTTYYLRSSVLGGQVMAEVNSSGAWTRGFVYLDGQLLAVQGGSGGQVNWVHKDPVTKSQRVTNSSGVLISMIDLDPWGGETGRSSNQGVQPHRYTTYERDSNGGDDAMMRRYQSSLSVFSQPDPYDGSYNLSDPQSFNRYAYVQNNPVNLVDPSGLMCMLMGSYTEGGEMASTYYLWACTRPDTFTPWEPRDPNIPEPVEPPQGPPQRDPSCTRVNAEFDQSGQGYYTYGPQNQRYGQPGMVAALQNFASGWNQAHPNNPIGVGDLSQFGGAPNWARHPGGGHAGGVIVDIRPMRNDNVQGGTNYNDRSYSFDLTNSLIQGLLGLPEVASVRFNDPNIQGTVRDARGHVHDNHLHVTFRDGFGCP